MPVTVSYPGVYVEEISNGVHTITPVSTSIGAFFGRASAGPINKPVRILSLADYTRNFGAPLPHSDLADSVRLFFLNGGSDCYVVRLANGAVKAEVTLRSLYGQKVLTATAKAEGAWANTVRLEVDYDTANSDESFNLKVIQESAGKVVKTESFSGLVMDPASPRYAPAFVSQSSDLITLDLHATQGVPGTPGAAIDDLTKSFAGISQARRRVADLAAWKTLLKGLVNSGTDPRSRFDISVNGSPFVTVDLAPWTNASIDAAALGGIATRFQTQIDTALAAVPPPIPTVTCSFAGGGAVPYLTIVAANGAVGSVRVRRSSSRDISAALMLGVDQGGIEPTRWSNFRPAPTGTVLWLGKTSIALPATLDDYTTTLDTLAEVVQAASHTFTIDGQGVDVNLLTRPPAGATKKWYMAEVVVGSPNGDNDGVREKLRLIAAAINKKFDLPWRAEVWQHHLVIRAKGGSVNNLPGSITTSPAMAAFDAAMTTNVRQYSLGAAKGSTGFASDGVDGTDGNHPEVADYLGDPALHTGFYALDTVDLFNLMVIAGDDEVPQTTYNQIWGPASVYAASRRALLLIDPPLGWTAAGLPAVVQNTAQVNDLRNSGVVKPNSAVFYPRLRYAAGGPVRTVGPAGAVAGVMARTDTTRGVWKAPAGQDADLRGIVGLEVKLTDLENGVLNKLGANVLRIFPTGTVVWGARTLAGSDDEGSEWKYIPIRRLALFLEESLFRGTKWVVFEPNDEPLWARVRLNLNAFMMGLFRQGAFQGSTPKDAYYVKCDAETTTQADRNLGIVNIEVGFAPLKPAEFVILKIQQIAGDL